LKAPHHGVAFRHLGPLAPVDVEALVFRTARATRDDERLFVGAASWLAAHHGWVNGRRLTALMTDLARIDRLGSAVAGALLTVASNGAGALDTGRATELGGAIDVCRPLARSRPLFSVMERFPTLRPDLRATALPVYSRWGLWHSDDSPKLTALPPAPCHGAPPPAFVSALKLLTAICSC